MKTNVLLVFTMIVLMPATALAQENEKRFGFELNSGVSMATNKLSETTPNPGFGFEGVFHYRFLPHLGVYAGWGLNRLGAEESFAGNDVCFEETGYIFGLQYKHPFGSSSFDYYLRLAGLYSHIETENSDGDVFNDTGHGFGWQAAGGIEIPIGNKWGFTPGIKFNALTRESVFEGVTKRLNHNYISLRIGIIKHF